METDTAILIVDDDPVCLAISEEIVASLGYQHCETVDNAPAGIDKLREAEFGLIILDLNMPGLDGLAFLRQVSEAGFQGRLIISSGETEAVLRTAEQMGRLLKLRVLGAIRKPLSRDKLALLLAADDHAGEPALQTPSPLPRNLAELELVPYYQAQHCASTGAVVGVEALIRARGPNGVIYGPGRLFGMVRSREELISTTLAMTKSVLDDMRQWSSNGCLRRTAINLDTSLVEDNRVILSLVEAVNEARIDPASICWELTETTLPRDVTRLMESLTRLRMHGFHLSLDDYGTGGSNFEILRLCPFTELKVDGVLLRSASEEVVSQRFIASAVGMAVDLGLHIVGEGVETREQHAFARQAGIDVIQGFLFSRPMPAEEIGNMLSGKRYVLVAD
jgi:EAL domain-containing protein (putative c-di-GMP-specific phosphodiesterase class I)